MTDRDQFAMAAMQGYLATFTGDMMHPAHKRDYDEQEDVDKRLWNVAQMSYQLADAMLDVRDEGE